VPIVDPDDELEEELVDELDDELGVDEAALVPFTPASRLLRRVLAAVAVVPVVAVA
jgi:hypothetical protein